MRWALRIEDDRQAASQCRRLKYGPRLCFRNGPAAGSTCDGSSEPTLASRADRH